MRLRAAASLLAACLVVSCATAPDTPSAEADGRPPAATADAGIERVVLQAYRAIGDRHLYEPNFRNLTVEAYRGFASSDSTLVLEASDSSLTVKRNGKEIVSRPAPADTTEVLRPTKGEIPSPASKPNCPSTPIRGALSTVGSLMARTPVGGVVSSIPPTVITTLATSSVAASC